MNGLSLPINVIVIIALAILVLVVIAAFFGLNLGLGSQNIAREQSLDRACREYRELYNCVGGTTNILVRHTEPGSSEQSYSLTALCLLSGLDDNECRKRCGCP